MTLLFDGQNAFFKERGRCSSHSVVIHLPEGGSLFLHGILHATEGDALHFPLDAFRVGENRLALRLGDRIYPTEGLFFDGDALVPAGLPVEGMLLTQNELVRKLTETVACLEDRIAALEKKSNARKLFS